MRNAALEKFVIESNAIEGYAYYQYGWDLRLFQQHYDALKFALDTADTNVLLEPNVIHLRLMFGLLPSHQTGLLRQIGVRVGSHIAPEPELAERLFAQWMAAAVRWTQHKPRTLPEAWWFHKAFEYIHPYVDGNGRTGRIVWAAMQRLTGIMCPIYVPVDEKQGYYAELAKFESAYTPSRLADELDARSRA